MLIFNPTTQQVVIYLYTKYNISSLQGCGEIFDEIFHSSKYRRKGNWTNTRKNKQKKTGSQSHYTTSRQAAYQISAF